MLLLLFHIGENLYAIDTSEVIEIVPMVILRSVQGAPESIAGVFNYHGAIVPVVDLCRILRAVSCPIRYSTRLIMIRNEINLDQKFYLNQRQCQLGLIAERVTETLNISDDAVKKAERASYSPYLGELFLTQKGMVQKLNLKHLVPDALAALQNGAKEQVNGAGLH